jgi:multicomponent Na+:H+ antiporter subunit G
MLQIVGASILLLGTFVCMFGAIGLLRLPNFFARTHGASITDTLGASLCLLGMIIFTFGMEESLKTNILVVVKLLSIGVFLMVTSPISGHALTRAAYRKGLGGKGAPDLEDVAALPMGIHGEADVTELLEGGIRWLPPEERVNPELPSDDPVNIAGAKSTEKGVQS